MNIARVIVRNVKMDNAKTVAVKTVLAPIATVKISFIYNCMQDCKRVETEIGFIA